MGKFQLTLASPEQTTWLATHFAKYALPGDTFLLDGPVGAGKSHFARSFIQAQHGGDTEVPSPSFTLVQTYGEGVDTIWHSDLYRLGSPDEIAETGLLEMFDNAICLVEWPDRLGAEIPKRYLKMTLQPDAKLENTRWAQVEYAGEWDWLENLTIQHNRNNTCSAKS